MSKLIDDKQECDMTDFGFKKIPRQEKTRLVADIFHSVASKYDVMNDLMSFGVHRWWKKFTVDYAHIRKGQRVLDLAGGTGDMTRKLSELVGDEGVVILADINDSMLRVGRSRLRDQGLICNIAYAQVDAESLPFADNYFDCIIISFGLRNITNKDRALRCVWRVLKPGGRLLILEFSKPYFGPLNRIYDFYSFRVLPLMGRLVADDEGSYRYLAESIRMHPDQDSLKQMIYEAGFSDVKYYNMSGGIVALHRGFKF